MRIIERCTHGRNKIGRCPNCKKIYQIIDRREHHALLLWRAAKYRARKRGVPFTIKVSDVLIPSHCIVLGIPLDSHDRDHTPSIDEVVQGLGYVPQNVCVISGRANRLKSDATIEEMQAVIYTQLRSKFALQGAPDTW
jgi:hypothetical protein